jgi:hypothetical protein
MKKIGFILLFCILQFHWIHSFRYPTYTSLGRRADTLCRKKNDKNMDKETPRSTLQRNKEKEGKKEIFLPAEKAGCIVSRGLFQKQVEKRVIDTSVTEATMTGTPNLITQDGNDSQTVLRFPVDGIQEFEAFRRENLYFFDKSHLIHEWEQNGYRGLVMLRPRRMGKSVACSMLESFYDINSVDSYKLNFEVSGHRVEFGRFLNLPLIFCRSCSWMNSLRGIPAIDTLC